MEEEIFSQDWWYASTVCENVQYWQVVELLKKKAKFEVFLNFTNYRL